MYERDSDGCIITNALVDCALSALGPTYTLRQALLAFYAEELTVSHVLKECLNRLRLVRIITLRIVDTHFAD